MGAFIVQATPAMVYRVSKHMRERDFQELLAVHFEDNREDLACGLAQIYGDRPFVFCIGRDDTPICILVGTLIHPGFWVMGMWATDDLPRIGKFLTRFAVTELFSAMREAGAHRVECKAIIGYDGIHKWLRFLGFAQGDTEKMYGKNKQDFITFYWCEGMPWPRGYKIPADDSRSLLAQP